MLRIESTTHKTFNRKLRKELTTRFPNVIGVRKMADSLTCHRNDPYVYFLIDQDGKRFAKVYRGKWGMTSEYMHIDLTPIKN